MLPDHVDEVWVVALTGIRVLARQMPVVAEWAAWDSRPRTTWTNRLLFPSDERGLFLAGEAQDASPLIAALPFELLVLVFVHSVRPYSLKA